MARSQLFIKRQQGISIVPEGPPRTMAATSLRAAAAELGLTPKGSQRAMGQAFHRAAVFARHLVAHGADVRLAHLMAELDAVRATIPGAREAAEFFAQLRDEHAVQRNGRRRPPVDPDRARAAGAM